MDKEHVICDPEVLKDRIEALEAENAKLKVLGHELLRVNDSCFTPKALVLDQAFAKFRAALGEKP